MFQGVPDIDIHRLNLSKSMDKWARKKEVEIDWEVKFAKINIDNMPGLKPNPGGGTVIHKSAEAGISILACRSQPASGQEHLRKMEAAQAASTVLWITSKGVKITTTGPCPPAGNYADLKVNITT